MIAGGQQEMVTCQQRRPFLVVVDLQVEEGNSLFYSDDLFGQKR